MRSKKVLESEASNYTMLFFFLILSAFLTISLPSIAVSSFEQATLHLSENGEGPFFINPLTGVFTWSHFLGFRPLLILQTFAAACLIYFSYNVLKKTFKDRELAVNSCFIVMLCSPWLFLQAQITPFFLEVFLVCLVLYHLNEHLHVPAPKRIVYSLIALFLLILESLWYLPFAALMVFFHKKMTFSLYTGIKLLFISPWIFLGLFFITGFITLQTQSFINTDLIALAGGSYLRLNHLIFAPFALLLIATPWFIKHLYLTKVMKKGKKKVKKEKQQKEKEAPLLLRRYIVLLLASILLAGTYLYNPFTAIFITILLIAPVLGNIRFPALSLVVPLLFLPLLAYTFLHIEGDFSFLIPFIATLYLMAILAALILVRLVHQKEPSRFYLTLSVAIVFFIFMNSFIIATFYYFPRVSRTTNLLQTDLYKLEDLSEEYTAVITDTYGDFFALSLSPEYRQHITTYLAPYLSDNDLPSNSFWMISSRTDIDLEKENWEHTPRELFEFYLPGNNHATNQSEPTDEKQ